MKYFDFNTTDYAPLSISQLKRLCDHELRQKLLREAKMNSRGYILCPLKEKHFPPEKMNASHFIDRQWMNTRWNLDNVHLISESSNVWDAQIMEDGYKSKHHKEYEEYLRKKIGEKNFKKLLEESKKMRIFARKDYIDLIEEFRNG